MKDISSFLGGFSKSPLLSVGGRLPRNLKSVNLLQ